jgi:hypothetical protein
MGYEALGKPRFVVEDSGPAELIRIKARKKIATVLVLPLWLVGWTIAGIFVMAVMLARAFSPFLLVWLCGWAAGWLAVAGTIAWTLFGSETLRVVDRDLEHGFRLGPWSRRKIYQGSQIRDLQGSAQLDSRSVFNLGPFNRSQTGAVKFSYGARTIRAAAGLDEAEGKLIVERLRRQLPATVSDG